ncbi:MAG: TonB-dependent receptor [Bacteroidales bacterium]
MKNFIVALIVFAGAALTAHAQHALQGHVFDAETGAPLSGAHIVLDQTYAATATNAQGFFQIRDLNAGSYVINITYVGYKTLEQEVEVEGKTTVSLELLPSPVLQDQVIIRATRAGNESPTSQSRLEKSEIEKKNMGRDLPFLLNTTPSVVTSSDAGTGIGYTSLRIRGTGPSRINVTINGIPLNDAESQTAFWVDLPDLASSIDNMQIQRGVGTSTHGSASFGASINIQTNTLRTDPYGEINSAAGSFNTFKNTLNFGTGLIGGRWTIDGRLSRLSSDGYIDRAFADLRSLYLSGGYYGEHSILRINIISGKEKTYQSWAGVPKDSLKTNRTYNPFTYENQTDNYTQDHYQLLYSLQLHKHWLLNTTLHYTYGRGYYEEYQDTGDPYAATSLSYYGLQPVIAGNDTITQTDLVRRKWLDNDFYGGTFSLNHNPKRWDIILGGGYNIYKGRSFGRIIWARYASNSFIGYQWYRSNSKKQDLNLFAKASFSLSGKVSINADMQYKHIDWDIAGTEDAFGDVSQHHYFNFLNPKAGVSYTINDHHSTYFSFGISNREPSRQNYVDATADQILPTSETLYDMELGYELRSKRTRLMANLYYMYYKDQLVATGEIDNVGYAILRNVPESYRAGVELAMGWKIVPGLKWDVNATFSQNKIRNFTESVDDFDNGGRITIRHGTTDISFSPDLIAGSILEWEITRGLEAGFVSKYVSRQYIDNTSDKERSLDPYLVSNLRLSYAIEPPFMDEISIRLQINNIFDEKYETHAWVYRYYASGSFMTSDGYFPQAGVNFMAGVNLKF